MAGEQPTSGELELAAARRERAERSAAAEEDEPGARRAHERRADKTGYLRERLAQRAGSEKEGT